MSEDTNHPTEMRTMIDGVREMLRIDNDVEAVRFIRQSVHDAVTNKVVDNMKKEKLREVESVFGSTGSWPVQGSVKTGKK
jgi:hypothetical protein